MALTQQGIVPDLFIVLDRPDHLVKDFCIGRCTDSLTGAIYHEKVRIRLFHPRRRGRGGRGGGEGGKESAHRPFTGVEPGAGRECRAVL